MRKTNKIQQKRTYKKTKFFKEPMKRIQNGKTWKLPVKIDKDVAPYLVQEQETTGANYGHLINEAMRAHYGINK